MTRHVYNTGLKQRNVVSPKILLVELREDGGHVVKPKRRLTNPKEI